MEWMLVIVPVVFVFIGWLFNTLITNKINDSNSRIKELEEAREKDKKEFYEQLNGLRKSIEDIYVRKDLYMQTIQSLAENSDQKHASLLKMVEDQFKHFGEKMDELKIAIKDKKGE